MKTKTIFFIIMALVVTIGVTSCSKNEINPEDFVTSVLSGDYGKGMLWKLKVTENGTPVENDGYVRFDSKYLQDADFRFVDVIPGEHEKEFKKIPLVSTDSGCGFSIECQSGDKKITITGSVTFGEMAVDLKM